jgi:hypothetical protein
VAKDSEHATLCEDGVVSLFGRTWQDMAGDLSIDEQYILDFGARCTHRMDDPNHPSHGWAGRGFTVRDGESTT